MQNPQVHLNACLPHWSGFACWGKQRIPSGTFWRGNKATLCKCRKSHPLQMPHPVSPPQASVGLRMPMLPITLPSYPLLIMEKTECFKSHFAHVRYYTAFLVTVRCSQQVSKTRRYHRHITPPALGRQARCGSGNNRLAAKRESRPGGRQQHACLRLLLSPATQPCQPSLEALQAWSYLELPVMIVFKCTVAQQFT